MIPNIQIYDSIHVIGICAYAYQVIILSLQSKTCLRASNGYSN